MQEKSEKKHLIIGGTFKSGTSSLYTYLNQHSQIHGSSIKETGFFVPARYDREIPDVETYYNYFKGAKPEQWLLEASPGYLYGGDSIIAAMTHSLRGELKLVFMFRNPSDRFISFFKMLSAENVQNVSTLVTDQNLSLEEYFEQCSAYSPQTNDINEDDDFILNGLRDGCYYDHLMKWYARFSDDQIKVVFFDDLGDGPEQVCRDICKWINIDPNEVADFNFRKVNQYRTHRSGLIKRIAQYINYRFESFFRKNEKLKRKLVSLYEKINGAKQLSNDDSSDIKKQLDEYYSVQNRKLGELLKSKGYQNLPEWCSID